MSQKVTRTLFLTILAVSAGIDRVSAQTDGAPTFSKDVAPILFESCVTCHRAGETAPMSLMSYEEARPWARTIRRAVATRQMPPWPADRRFGKFSNDPSLTDSEIETIVRWVDAGAPKGNPADLPKAPVFASGWRGGKPDYVFEMPVDYKVPADGQLDILHFWTRIPFGEDRFVEALELRPGNTSVVHHSRVDVVDVPAGMTVVNGVLVAKDGDQKAASRISFDTQDSNFHLISFVPGRGYERHPRGTAKRIEAGKWIRFELHYNPNGQATTDRTKLGVWFAKGPVSREVHTRSVGQSLSRMETAGAKLFVQGKELIGEPGPDGRRKRPKMPNIPPHAGNWEVIGETMIPEPITLLALSPHMHLRGKDLKWIVEWPDGRKETILSVPNYDYNWQINFELETPLRLPAGSKLIAIGHYDNSAKNKYNPAPDKEVYWSDQSWDEMFIPYIEFTKDNERPSATDNRQGNKRK